MKGRLTRLTRRAASLGVTCTLSCCSSQAASLATHAAPVEPVVASEQGRLEAPLVVRDVGFDAPESVLYDARADLYLVSNVVGTALAHDDQAFISRVRPDGSMAALKWIDSAQPDVLLDAPKGMVLVDDVLYVTDIDCIRKFDRVSGRPVGSIDVPGASFLHDLTIDRAGTVYITDSGLGEGLSASGTDAIYRITKAGTLGTLAKSRALGQPSGLWCDGDDLWVTSFGTGELYRLSASGERSAGQRLSKGSLDGIVMYEGTLFVSSWEAGAVYERSPGGFHERLTELDAPADLGLDTKRRRLLITHYNVGALSIHQL